MSAPNEDSERTAQELLESPSSTDDAGDGEPDMTHSTFVEAALRVLDWKAVVTLAAAIFLGLGVWELVRILAGPIALLLAGITIAEALTPTVDFLSRRISRNYAITVVYIVLLIVVGLLGWLVVPRLIDQSTELLNRVPSLLDEFQRSFGGFAGVSSQDLINALSSEASSFATRLSSVSFAVVRGVLDVLVIIFMSLYWLIAAPGLKKFFLSLLPEERRGESNDVLTEMSAAMGGYVRGVIIDAAIMGVLAAVGLFIIGVNYPIVLGVLTMLGELVPVIGPVIVAFPIVGVALLQSPTKALLALGLYVALEQFEGHILTPNIMRSQTHVSQVLVIFALVAGAAIGGLLWAVVAIPLAGALRVLTLRVLAPWIRQWSGADRSTAKVASSEQSRVGRAHE